jgi:hypothetical protein
MLTMAAAAAAANIAAAGLLRSQCWELQQPLLRVQMCTAATGGAQQNA